MSEFLRQIKSLVQRGDYVVSLHGSRELAADAILLDDVLGGLDAAALIEEYATFGKGPCVLVLQHDAVARPVHVLWGVPKGQVSSAVLITAYRPDPGRWSGDFSRRKKR